MKAAKRIKIRLEKHELKVIRFSQNENLFCQNCQIETRHLTVAQSATVFEVSEKTIFRLVESGRLHSVETGDGKLMICFNSGEAQATLCYQFQENEV